MRIGDRSVLDNRAGIAHRDRVILPRSSEPLDAGDHLLRRHLGTGRKLPRRVMPGGKNFHMSSADINHQHVHAEPLIAQMRQFLTRCFQGRALGFHVGFLGLNHRQQIGPRFDE